MEEDYSSGPARTHIFVKNKVEAELTYAIILVKLCPKETREIR